MVWWFVEDGKSRGTDILGHSVRKMIYFHRGFSTSTVSGVNLHFGDESPKLLCPHPLAFFCVQSVECGITGIIIGFGPIPCWIYLYTLFAQEWIPSMMSNIIWKHELGVSVYIAQLVEQWNLPLCRTSSQWKRGSTCYVLLITKTKDL